MAVCRRFVTTTAACLLLATTACNSTRVPSSAATPRTVNKEPVADRAPRVIQVGFNADSQATALPPLREPTEQEVASAALARIGAPAVPSLIQGLRHQDPYVREQAALVLAKIGPEARAAVGELTAALDDEDSRVRKAASRALGQIGPAAGEAVPALMRSLMQPAPSH